MAKERSKEDLENVSEETEVQYEEVDGASQGDDLGARLYRAQEYFAQNQNLLLGILAGVAVVVGAAVWYYFDREEAKMEAQRELIKPVFYFENDSLDKALNGTVNNMGLLAIADEYSGTPAGDLANFYVGAIYLQKGRFQEAIEYLQNFESNDYLMNARKYSLIGDAYLEQKNFEKASSHYERAVNAVDDPFYTPQYLMKLALAQELNKDFQAAFNTYERVTKEYPKSTEAPKANKYKGMVEAFIANPELANEITQTYQPEDIKPEGSGNTTPEDAAVQQPIMKKPIQGAIEIQPQGGDTIQLDLNQNQ